MRELVDIAIVLSIISGLLGWLVDWAFWTKSVKWWGLFAPGAAFFIFSAVVSEGTLFTVSLYASAVLWIFLGSYVMAQTDDLNISTQRFYAYIMSILFGGVLLFAGVFLFFWEMRVV